MDARFAAGVVALTGGLILNGGPEASQSRPPTDGPAVRVDTSLVSPGIVSRSHRTNDRRCRADVSPCRRAATAAAARRERCSCRRAGQRDAGLQAVAAVRQSSWPRAPVIAARAVETDDGLHVHVPLRVASRLWRRPGGRPRLERQSLGLSARGRREAAAVQVRSESQADPAGRPGRDRLPGQGARDGRRCRGQCLDYGGERRHGDEDQSRGQAAPDDRRAGTPGGLE